MEAGGNSVDVQEAKVMVETGLDIIRKSPQLLDGYGNLGLLYNQASISSTWHLAPDVINSIAPGRLKVLFGPQHGVGLTEQDNMIESSHLVHEKYHVPIYSLYESSRRPSPEMLEEIDTVLVDILDVGTRVYTFATTVLYVMKACAELGKSVVILDRPNPVNGLDVEGNVLDPTYASFVGPYPIPMRHGLSLGELMSYYNSTYSIGCDLTVIRMTGWSRGQYFDETGLTWAMPSPNMPTVDTAVVYPGQVLFEGTEVSEGRGTTRPFEIFGAPYFDTRLILENLESSCLMGSRLREVSFAPTFNKFARKRCSGFQIHVTDRSKFRPYLASLAILSAIVKTHGAEFELYEGPYEYVFNRRPIDVIIGDKKVSDAVMAGVSVKEIEGSWQNDLNRFIRDRAQFMLYP